MPLIDRVRRLAARSFHESRIGVDFYYGLSARNFESDGEITGLADSDANVGRIGFAKTRSFNRDRVRSRGKLQNSVFAIGIESRSAFNPLASSRAMTVAVVTTPPFSSRTVTRRSASGGTLSERRYVERENEQDSEQKSAR